MSVVNQRSHIAEKESKYKCDNMTSVNICIAHDNDLVISQAFDIENAFSIFFFNADAKSSKHILDLLIVIDLMFKCFFDVKDFSAQRQDSLKITITALLRCTTGA